MVEQSALDFNDLALIRVFRKDRVVRGASKLTGRQFIDHAQRLTDATALEVTQAFDGA
jgi:hypothetical protein